MFGLYVLTTAISGGVFYLTSKAYDGYLKRNHYISTTGEKKLAELNFEILSYAFKALMPGYNIYMAVKMLWDGPKQFEVQALESLKKGKIREMTDEEIENEEALESYELVDNNYNNTENETFLVDATTIKQHSSVKSYNELTAEEKLAFLRQEQAFLLESSKEKKEAPVQFKLGQK